MKKNLINTILLGGTLFFVACGGTEPKEKTEPNTKETAAEKISGEKLFNDNACSACHQPEDKTVGPSLQEIAIAYKGNADGMKAFLKEEGEAIVDPELFPTMQVNLAITKAMNDEELTALTDYIMKY